MNLLDASLGNTLGGSGANVGRRSSNHPSVDALVEYPGRSLFVERSHIHGVPGQCECLAVAGLQAAGLAEGLEFLAGLVEAALGSTDVELNHFTTCHLAGVGDLHFHLTLVAIDSRRNDLVVEGGVGETEAEGEGDGLLIGVEVTIADVDVLGIDGVIDVLHLDGLSLTLCTLGSILGAATAEGAAECRHVEYVVGREVLVGWSIAIGNLPGHWETARRIHLAGENVHHAVAAFLTRLEGTEDGIDFGSYGSSLDRTADVEHEDDGLAGLMIGLGHGVDHILLEVGEEEVLALAVGTFATGATQGDDGHVVVLYVLGEYVSLWNPFASTQWSGDAEGRHAVGIVLLVLVGDVLLVGLGEAHVGLDASLAGSLDEANDVGTNVGATEAHGSGNHIIRGAAVEGDALHIVGSERQSSNCATLHRLVLEQYHRLGTKLANCLGMGLEVGLVGIDISVGSVALEHELEGAAYRTVDEFHRECAVLSCLEERLALTWLTGLQHVVACLDAGHGILAGVPVAHHQSVPTPLIAEDGLGEFDVLTGVEALGTVVGGHDAPGIGLLDSNLEIL